MTKRPFFFALGLFALAACMTWLPRVSPAQKEWAAQQWPDMGGTKLEEARALYVDRCSGCHNLVLPEKHTMEQWDILLSTMAPRAKINAEQQQQIRRYLLTAKSAPPQ